MSDGTEVAAADKAAAQTAATDKQASAEKSAKAPRPQLSELLIQGEARMNASISMLYTDILSQELNSALSSQDAIQLVQKHLQNRPLEQISQKELAPLMENVPDHILNLAKEVAFSSGALVKRVPCRMPLKIGEGFIFRGSGLIAEIELKDGRVTEIRRLLKR